MSNFEKKFSASSTTTNMRSPSYASLSSLTPHHKMFREWYGYDNADWANPALETQDSSSSTPTEKAPCTSFYATGDVAQIDLDCWQLLRGAAAEDVNQISNSSQTSCLSNQCADPTSYGDMDIPPSEKLCTWVQCIQQNKTACSSTLYNTVVGSDANATTIASMQCPTSPPSSPSP
jgi:hypothetical protein